MPALLTVLAVAAVVGGDLVVVAVLVALLASPALLAGLSLVMLLLGDPARHSRAEPMVEAPEPAPIPGPEPAPPVDLDIVQRWWQELVVPRAPPRPIDDGTPGVDRFFGELAQLSGEHLVMRELLVAPGLDVDAIVLGPTGARLFEVKHWSGKIVCRDGQWVRHKYYASGDYLGPEPIPDHRRFDRQWLREAKAVDKTSSSNSPASARSGSRRRAEASSSATPTSRGISTTHANRATGTRSSGLTRSARRPS